MLAHGFQQTHVKLLGAILDILIKSSFIARFQQISCKGIPFMTIFVPRELFSIGYDRRCNMSPDSVRNIEYHSINTNTYFEVSSGGPP
jgi:hypothetical protein